MFAGETYLRYAVNRDLRRREVIGLDREVADYLIAIFTPFAEDLFGQESIDMDIDSLVSSTADQTIIRNNRWMVDFLKESFGHQKLMAKRLHLREKDVIDGNELLLSLLDALKAGYMYNYHYDIVCNKSHEAIINTLLHNIYEHRRFVALAEGPSDSYQFDLLSVFQYIQLRRDMLPVAVLKFPYLDINCIECLTKDDIKALYPGYPSDDAYDQALTNAIHNVMYYYTYIEVPRTTDPLLKDFEITNGWEHFQRVLTIYLVNQSNTVLHRHVTEGVLSLPILLTMIENLFDYDWPYAQKLQKIFTWSYDHSNNYLDDIYDELVSSQHI